MFRKYMVILSILVWVAPPVQAGEYTDKLTDCMIQNTTEAQQTLMMRWVFSVFSSHAQIQDFFSYPFDSDRHTALDKQIAAVVSDLIFATCRQQLVVAFIREGKNAPKVAGQKWIETAFVRFSKDPIVRNNFSSPLQYLDISKFNLQF